VFIKLEALKEEDDNSVSRRKFLKTSKALEDNFFMAEEDDGKEHGADTFEDV